MKNDVFGRDLKVGDVCITIVEGNLVPCIIMNEHQCYILNREKMFNLDGLQLFLIKDELYQSQRLKLLNQYHNLQKRKEQALIKKKRQRKNQIPGMLCLKNGYKMYYMGYGKISIKGRQNLEKTGHIYINQFYYLGHCDNEISRYFNTSEIKITKSLALVEKLDYNVKGPLEKQFTWILKSKYGNHIIKFDLDI